jgi:hypothetical protein
MRAAKLLSELRQAPSHAKPGGNQMPYINEIVGLFFLAIGAAAVVVAITAFWRVQFGTAKREERSFGDTLKHINALLNTWLEILRLIPERFRHIFVLLPIGVVLMASGLWVLVQKPI